MEAIEQQKQIIGKYIQQQIAGRYSVPEFACQLGINKFKLQGIIDGKISPSDYLLDRVCALLLLNRFYVFYLAGRWAPEHRGLSQDEFQRRFGFGIVREMEHWAIAS